MTPTKSCIEHCKKLLNPRHVFTKGEIQGINKMLNAMRFSEAQGKLNGETLIAVLRLRESKDITQRITPEQTAQGLEYLKSIQLKRSDGFKKGSGFEHLNNRFGSSYEQNVIKTAYAFEFVGFAALANGLGEYCFSVPIYAIKGKTWNAGSPAKKIKGSVDYSPVHWSPSILWDHASECSFENMNHSDVTIEQLRAFGIIKK